MPIDASQVKWDESPAIDPRSIQWDNTPVEQSSIDTPKGVLGHVKDIALSEVQRAKNMGGGFLHGTADIGRTLITGGDLLTLPNQKLYAALTGGEQPTIESVLANDAERRASTAEGLTSMGVDNDSLNARAGRFGAHMVGTAEIGGLLAKGGQAIPFIANSGKGRLLLEAMKNFGMSKTTAAGVPIGLGTRTAAGAATGLASGAIVDPRTAVESAVFSGVAPGALGLAGWTGNKLYGGGKYFVNAADEMFGGLGGTQRSVGRVGNEIIGSDATPQVAAMLRNAPASQTAGQATRDASIPQLAAAQEFAKEQLPKEFMRVNDLQEAARMSLLKNVTPDVNKLTQLRGEITAPMRTTELNAANTAGIKGQELYDKGVQKFNSLVSATKVKGQLATGAAQQKVLSENFYPVEGMPRIAAKYSNNADRIPEYISGADDAAKIAKQRRIELDLAQYQLNSIKEHGLDTLKSSNVLQSIDKTLNVPGTRASDVVQKSLGYFKEKIASLTDGRGIVDARDLYTVRKEIGNNIKNFAKDSGNWDKKMTAGLQRDIQKSIDDAITQAGGGGWNKYLQTYSKFSNAIERSKTMNELMSVIEKGGGGERRTPFLNAMKDADGELKRLSPSQRGAVSNVSEQLKGQARDELLASKGRAEFNRIIKANESAPTFPAYLDRAVTVTNAIIRRASGKGGAAVDKELARLMLPENKKELANLLEKSLPKEREEFMKAVQVFKESVGRTAPLIPAQNDNNKQHNGRLSEMAR